MASRKRLFTVPGLLLLAALACTLPKIGGREPTPGEGEKGPEFQAGPTPTPLPPLPPTLVERVPAPGEELRPDGEVTLYFDQPMDRPSVESALQVEPPASGEITWLDDQTLTFRPSEPLARASAYRMTITEGARSSEGLSLSNPILVAFKTVGYLEPVQVSPIDGAVEIDPNAAISVVFNRPVVPLQVGAAGPQPLKLDPAIPGRGEWIDTSIYVFRPDEPLPAGATITARLGNDFSDLTGANLREPFAWSFTTAEPRVISVEPDPSNGRIALDSKFTLTFNQPMDTESVAGAFELLAAGSREIDGVFSWNEDLTQVTFTPNESLRYDDRYFLTLRQAARTKYGVQLPREFQANLPSVPQPGVTSTDPAQDGIKDLYRSVEIKFNAPMSEASLIRALSISPAVENRNSFWDDEENTLSVSGEFAPGTEYRLTIADTAVDPYGTRLEAPFELTFTTSDLAPRVDFTRFSDGLALTSGLAPNVEIQALNLSSVNLRLYRLTLEEAFQVLKDPSFLFGNAAPRGQAVREWSLTPPSLRNKTQTLSVQLSQTPLTNGVYLLLLDTPDDDRRTLGRVLVVRQVELVMKTTQDSTFVWAVDLADGQAVSDLNVLLLNESGVVVTSGQTDAEGVYQAAVGVSQEPQARLYAVTGAPGQARFGFTASSWADGIQPYQFDVAFTPSQPEHQLYLYTDRPIYRPGHRVRYRGVLRQFDEARYPMPTAASVEVELHDSTGAVVERQTVQLSEYGTFDGEITLSKEAGLGYYTITTDDGSIGFQVAAYRKPEFTVEVTPSQAEVVSGDGVTATIHGEYFFGGPVPEAEVHWNAFSLPTTPPGIPSPVDWFVLAGGEFGRFSSEFLDQGEGLTGSDGSFEVNLLTRLEDGEPRRVVIEATLTDEAGFPVTGRGEYVIHPAEVYLSLIPERYSLHAGDEGVVRLQARDWEGTALAGQKAEVLVERLTWNQVVDSEGEITWRSEASPVNEASLTTNDSGSVLFSFVPEEGGTYRVTANGPDARGREAHGEVTLWVSGEGGGVWRQPASGRMALVPDQESYNPGDVASVLIPSPFDSPTTALVTIERAGVLSHQVGQLMPSDPVIEVPIEAIHAPNVFLAVTLVKGSSDGGAPAISVGLVELKVNTEQLEMEVTLTPDRTTAGPGEALTYSLEARDAKGQPVQAEFSLALVDLAALSLANPNSPSPLKAFYGRQPLRVRTGASLAVSAEGGPKTPPAEGVGGGGGGPVEAFEVRSEFPDTAYWNPSVVTDAEGHASVSVDLPDSLTTWRMDARGVTLDTLVGSSTVDVVATKDLLIRPITPRFFTAGDAASVAAVVNNNTSSELSVEVRLVANGAEITNPPTETLTVPAGGQKRVDWSLVIQEVETVSLTFQAAAGDLQDASQPTIGSTLDGGLPVLRYNAPDTAATAGAMAEEGERLEAINLPRRFDAEQGGLRVVVEPSLGAAMNTALEALTEGPDLSTEAAVSRFLPNLALYRAAEQLGLRDPDLQARLERAINEGIQTLSARQHFDGGWSWWLSGTSDAYITAYVLFGLAEAQRADLAVDPSTIDRSVEFLRSKLMPTEGMAGEAADFDRQAFILFALNRAGRGDPARTAEMAEARDRLSNSGRALLGMTLAESKPEDEHLPALLADLQTAASRSATGVHWEEAAVDRWNMGSSVRTTAQVVMALLALDGGNADLPNAVRWLLAARSSRGDWGSTHESAWALLALSDWLEASGGLRAEFEYNLTLNGSPWSAGTASPETPFASVELEVLVSELFADRANQLGVQRGPGEGTLFYTAHLTVFRPVEEAEPTQRGMSVARQVYLYDGQCGSKENPCPRAESAKVGDELLMRITLTVPDDQYYVAVEDPFPAGVEPVDFSLRTTPSEEQMETVVTTDPASGDWGWWWFNRAELHDDRLALFADYLPAGTYQYTYRAQATLSGEFRVLPPRAWAVYFPEVYGQGAGTVFTIQP